MYFKLNLSVTKGKRYVDPEVLEKLKIDNWKTLEDRMEMRVDYKKYSCTSIEITEKGKYYEIYKRINKINKYIPIHINIKDEVLKRKKEDLIVKHTADQEEIVVRFTEEEFYKIVSKSEIAFYQIQIELIDKDIEKKNEEIKECNDKMSDDSPECTCEYPSDCEYETAIECLVNQVRCCNKKIRKLEEEKILIEGLLEEATS